MNDNDVVMPRCPRCNTELILAPLVKDDEEGLRYGGIFKCPGCGWDDWGHLVDSDTIQLLKKQHDTLHEV